MHLTRSLIVLASFLVAISAAVGLVAPVPALADGDNGIQAHPFEFVGKAGDCDAGYPAGARIVTARWLKGMGLPDNGGLNFNTTIPANAPNKNDPHQGLLLSKNGATPICSAAGASITGVKGMTVGPTFALGYDYRNGGHCGAGAPRFNVVVKPPSGPDTFHFVGGCANDNEASPAPQDPLQWTRVRHETSDAGESFPVIPVGSKIKSISIIFDEGTDTANNDTQGVGLAVLDNIFINGAVISGPGGDNHHGGDDDHDDDDDD